jgi:hypothetical protein
VADVDAELTARGLETTVQPDERALLDAAIRSGRFRRRLWIEAHYVTVAPRLFLARRVPRASKLLRVS